ncbi:hypothetical protein RF11_01399 [Thelohanellus kitauei]|uniref:Uncharacterized protein n=1 Tax=Thelohanellus kitauei TaxID=669202 RepID=A0A0C2J1V1_THEKT|nr:hypothetical protein RF11_01399 [Thelohanellus kitauei]
MQAKSKFTYLLTLFVVNIHAPRPFVIDDVKLSVVVIGDIGVREAESVIKQRVVQTIQREHQSNPFRLGINLGGNQYPHGSATEDFQTLKDVFALSFPKNVFQFDFLTVAGKVDHDGDVYTQLHYYLQDPRFHMPRRHFYYGMSSNVKDVQLSDMTLIRFVCIDSTPLYSSHLSN